MNAAIRLGWVLLPTVGVLSTRFRFLAFLRALDPAAVEGVIASCGTMAREEAYLLLRARKTGFVWRIERVGGNEYLFPGFVLTDDLADVVDTRGNVIGSTRLGRASAQDEVIKIMRN